VGGTAGLARYRAENWCGGVWDLEAEDSRRLPIVTASSQSARRPVHSPVADADANPIAPVILRAGIPAAQVRGVLAERVIVSTQLDPFLPLRALATYSGLSVRTLRDYLTDPVNPLPYYRVGGKILVRRSEFDGWIAAYRQRGHRDVAQVVDEVLRTL